MLLITGKALPNVLGAHVQLGSQDRSTYIDLGAVSSIDAVDCRCLDRLTGEHPFFGRLI
jgi:hypothetical protein